MKVKILILIYIIFFTNSYVLADVTYKKQISAETEVQQKIEYVFTQKKFIYRMLLLDDYARNGMIGRITKTSEYYSNTLNSDNYKYSLEAIKLYHEMVDIVLNNKTLSPEVKKILIPDNVYDKLDKNIVDTINTFNIILEGI